HENTKLFLNMKTLLQNNRLILRSRCYLSGWLTVFCSTGLALAVAGSDDEKSAAHTTSGAVPARITLPAPSARFVEIAQIVPQSNQLWGRRIPGRVSFPTSGRMNAGVLVEGRVEDILVRPGQKVEAGQRLLRLQSTAAGQVRADAEQAASRLDVAESA